MRDVRGLIHQPHSFNSTVEIIDLAVFASTPRLAETCLVHKVSGWTRLEIRSTVRDSGFLS